MIWINSYDQEEVCLFPWFFFLSFIQTIHWILLKKYINILLLLIITGPIQVVRFCKISNELSIILYVHISGYLMKSWKKLSVWEQRIMGNVLICKFKKIFSQKFNFFYFTLYLQNIIIPIIILDQKTIIVKKIILVIET